MLRLFLKICDAVNAAHLRGIVHRDLKPSNIRVDERGEPRVLDFGLAHMPMPDSDEGPSVLTLSGHFLGSLPWASPEQAEGRGNRVDTRSDVYALGVILYQMLTGKFPYEVAGAMRDVLNNIVMAQPSPPSVTVTEALATRHRKTRASRRRTHTSPINPAIDAIVLKALAKDPEQHYQPAHVYSFGSAHERRLEQFSHLRRLLLVRVSVVKLSTPRDRRPTP